MPDLSFNIWRVTASSLGPLTKIATSVCVAFKPQTAWHCPSTALLTNASVVIYRSPGTFEISTAQEGFQDLMGPNRHGPPQCRYRPQLATNSQAAYWSNPVEISRKLGCKRAARRSGQSRALGRRRGVWKGRGSVWGSVRGRGCENGNASEERPEMGERREV
ncbi:hypothetical protein FA13DRAFT_1720488 [Coprinellus micaceus]|uniref:Uncharacterized protein n=1 Tax=Coprinellus micaceus TaxID=71717 RepID=A0A4Y7S911_COPMI|nr:hypothetical protein FA13DRAFT_1720488 [Coprinellus micaceus]